MERSIIKEFLKKVQLFKELGSEELDYLTETAEERTYEAAERLFIEHNNREYLFVLYDGEVELYKKSPYGEEKRLALFGRYDFFGEASLVDDSPHSTNARALLRTTAIVFPSKQVKTDLQQKGALAVGLLSQVARTMSRRMRSANTRVMHAGAQYESGRTRSEHDLLGDRDVPFEYYYGVQTLRGLENFAISGIPLSFYPVLIETLAMVKAAAARANFDLGLLSKPITDAILQSCREIMNGQLHSHFVVDMIQGGAGTSTNMNANEVIANRALEILGYERGDYSYCHPNNHVNLSQSTNDAYPTSVKIAIINSNKKLVAVLQELILAMQAKANEFSHVIKMGRTQLQDAVPMTLGQTFEAFSVTLQEETERLDQNAQLFLEVNMGGTAIGTGINADPRYTDKVIERLREITELPIVKAKNFVEATQDTGAFIMYSSALKRLAVKLSKISNDLRLLSSGPRTGIHEINLPPMQPGSSIMPGKVNPVIPEVVNQIAFKVIGNDLTVTLAAEAGQLELNVMEPIIVHSIFESIEMLKNGMSTLTHRCILGITANETECRAMVERSIGIVTALNPYLGYDVCTHVAKEALETNRGVAELVIEKKLMTREELDRVLSPESMIGK